MLKYTEKTERVMELLIVEGLTVESAANLCVRFHTHVERSESVTLISRDLLQWGAETNSLEWRKIPENNS